MTYFLQLLITGVSVGCIYALAALGFVLIYKSSRVINFAQGELLAIGAFTVYGLTVWLGINIWLSLVIALALSFLFGLAVERTFLRPMIGEPTISVIMVTIGLASLLSGLVFFTPFGTLNTRFPRFLPSQPIEFGGLLIRWEQLLGIALTALFLGVLVWFFTRSTLGIAMRAVADDQLASLSVGVSVERVFGLAWAAAGVSATAAGFVVGNLSSLSFAGADRHRPQGVSGGDFGWSRLDCGGRWSAVSSSGYWNSWRRATWTPLYRAAAPATCSRSSSSSLFCSSNRTACSGRRRLNVFEKGCRGR